MKRPVVRAISVWAAALGAGLLVIVSCVRAPKMPAVDGAVVEIRRSGGAIEKGEPGYETALQLYWFGSGCHVIRLGDATVLTDPFVTNDLRLNGMRSDPERVRVTLGRIPVPDAVLVNHSHHDHILDAFPAMNQPSWRRASVPLYGGQSCRNLLAGWQDDTVLERCHVLPNEGGRIQVPVRAPGYSAQVTAYRTKHSPHLKCGLTFSNGLVTQPLSSPPQRLFQFKTGEAYNYLVTLRSPSGKTFTVFYLGAPYHLDELPESLPPRGTSIDVVLLLAPSAGNVKGYPEEHLDRLRPRHIVLSHFNTFVREDPDEQLSVLGRNQVKMEELLRDIQSTFAGRVTEYPEFEKLHVPAITRISESGIARNVIVVR